MLCAQSLQSCPTLCNSMECNPPGSSIHGILQARILEQIAVPSSKKSSRPRDRICVSCVSCTGRQVLYHGTTWEALNMYLGGAMISGSWQCHVLSEVPPPGRKQNHCLVAVNITVYKKNKTSAELKVLSLCALGFCSGLSFLFKFHFLCPGYF